MMIRADQEENTCIVVTALMMKITLLIGTRSLTTL